MLASGHRDTEQREGVGGGVFKKENNPFDKETPVSKHLEIKQGCEQTSASLLNSALSSFGWGGGRGAGNGG